MGNKARPKPTWPEGRTEAQRAEDTQVVLADLEAERGGQAPGTDRVERDLSIFRANLRGIDVYDLAATYDLSPDHVRRIIKKQRRENQRLSQMDPVEVVEELTSQIDAGISEIAAVAAREKGSVRVTAVLGRINALIQKGKWLQSAGILPEEAGQLRVQIEAGNLAQNIFQVLERRGLVDDDLLAEIYAQTGGGTIDADAVEVEMNEIGPGSEV
jgi:hypothetical protein